MLARPRGLPADTGSGLSRPTLGRSYWVYAGLIMLSFAGSIAHVIAMTWLLLRGAHGPTYVALAFLLSAIPSIILFRIVRRPVADNRLTTRLSALDVAQATLAGAVPLLAWAGVEMPRSGLLVQEFLLSCCGAFVFPLSRALLVRTAPPGGEMAANSASAAVFQIGNSLGALGGGVLVAVLGPYPAMGINAVTFLLSAAGVRFIVRPIPRDGVTHRSGGAAGQHGEATSMSNARLVGLLIVGTVALLSVQRLFLGSLGPLVATQLGGSAMMQGGLQLTFTVGGIAGGLIIARHAAALQTRSSVRVVLLLCAAAFLAVATLSSLPAISVACFLLGLAVSFWSVFQSKLQMWQSADQQAGTLARIGLWQSLVALSIFAVQALLSVRLAVHLITGALGLCLAFAGLLATGALGRRSTTQGV